MNVSVKAHVKNIYWYRRNRWLKEKWLYSNELLMRSQTIQPWICTFFIQQLGKAVSSEQLFNKKKNRLKIMGKGSSLRTQCQLIFSSSIINIFSFLHSLLFFLLFLIFLEYKILQIKSIPISATFLCFSPFVICSRKQNTTNCEVLKEIPKNFSFTCYIITFCKAALPPSTCCAVS